MMSAEEKRLIELLGCKVEDLPTLPEVAYQTFQMTNDDEHSSHELAKVIGRDPSFASRLLKVANSAGYGLSTKVASVQRAIVVLGVDEVRELALSLAAFAAAGSKRPIRRRFHRNQLWTHSKLVGLICETLAIHELGLGRGHYIAGLLHDIGKVAIDAFRSKEFDQVMDLVERKKLSWQEAELEILGFDHCQVGEAMMNYWHFPKELIAAVAAHHDPWSWKGEGRREASLVFLADHLAHLSENTTDAAPRIDSDSLLNKLGMKFDPLMAERVIENVRTMELDANEMEF